MRLSIVMPGLEPGIHGLPPRDGKTWMAGTSPAMTTSGGSDPLHGLGLVAQKPEPDTRGLEPGIHVLGRRNGGTWIAGTTPAMTSKKNQSRGALTSRCQFSVAAPL